MANPIKGSYCMVTNERLDGLGAKIDLTVDVTYQESPSIVLDHVYLNLHLTKMSSLGLR